ncbi:hypothetical protein OAO87_01350 [bacterium]|nr:hypothetical protein [bacterium]
MAVNMDNSSYTMSEQKAYASDSLPSKTMREGSPTRGMNPDALAFQPTAVAAQSGQQFGDAASFTRTFTRPASSHNNVLSGSGSRDADDARPPAPGRSA